VKKLKSKESSAIGDSSKDSTKCSSQGTLQCLKAPQGAIGQDLCLQGVGKAPISWEQHLFPGRLSAENLEWLTEKVGTLALRATRNNRCGAVKKRARKAKMLEALTGDSVSGQKQVRQELSSSATQGKEEKRVKYGTRQGGPASSEGRGPSQDPSKRQRSFGGGWTEAQNYWVTKLCQSRSGEHPDGHFVRRLSGGGGVSVRSAKRTL
jgi:hypothetical protein